MYAPFLTKSTRLSNHKQRPQTNHQTAKAATSPNIHTPSTPYPQPVHTLSTLPPCLNIISNLLRKRINSPLRMTRRQ